MTKKRKPEEPESGTRLYFSSEPSDVLVPPSKEWGKVADVRTRKLVRYSGTATNTPDVQIAPTLQALAREYVPVDAATWAAAVDLARSVEDPAPLDQAAARILADVILSLACAEHPEEVPRCPAHVRREGASRAAKAGAGSPARAAASRANASKPRPSRKRDAPRQGRRKKALDS